MKFNYTLLIIALFISLSFFPAFATDKYWQKPAEIQQPYEIEKQKLSLIDRIKQGFEGVARSIAEIFGGAMSSIEGFFSGINQWFGEFVFLFRLAYWLLLLIFIQIFFIAFWVFLIKLVLKIYVSYHIFDKPETAVRSIAGWVGSNIATLDIRENIDVNKAIALIKLLEKI